MKAIQISLPQKVDLTFFQNKRWLEDAYQVSIILPKQEIKNVNSYLFL